MDKKQDIDLELSITPAPRTKYNTDNPFWKIINKKLPANIIKESKYALAFEDIHPQDNIHILVIPKGQYATYVDFISYASPKERICWADMMNYIINQYAHKGGKIMINLGYKQEVPHLHAHVMMH